MADVEKIASEGFAAQVDGEISGRANYMVGYATEEECRAALRKLYPTEKIVIRLQALPVAAIIDLKLRVNEVRPFNAS
jgi:hypothetical protein